MHLNFQTVSNKTSEQIVLSTNSVIRNTYILLSLTLLFGAITAFVGVATYAPPLGIMILPLYFGLFFLVHATKNSGWGILSVFILTGFLGYTAAPMINAVLAFSNGGQIVASALGLTGAVFISISAYAVTTKKDFSYLAGFLLGAAVLAMIASLLAFFTLMPMLSLGISCACVLIATGFILFETSQIVNGGEKNYIVATVALYAQIYNLFISLLHILAIFTGRND